MKNLRRSVGLMLLGALAACDGISYSKDRTMPDLPNVKSNFAFTCAYEKK